MHYQEQCGPLKVGTVHKNVNDSNANESRHLCVPKRNFSKQREEYNVVGHLWVSWTKNKLVLNKFCD